MVQSKIYLAVAIPAFILIIGNVDHIVIDCFLKSLFRK
jgi:hypothetical protein